MVDTAPVVVLREIPAGQDPAAATVASPLGPSVAAAPLTRSLRATLAIGVEATPETAEPLAVTATMLAVSLTVSVAVAQLGGVFLSHS